MVEADTDPEYAIDQLEPFFREIADLKQDDCESLNSEKSVTELMIDIRGWLRTYFRDDDKKYRDLENDRRSYAKKHSFDPDDPLTRQKNYEYDLDLIKFNLNAYKKELESIINFKKKRSELPSAPPASQVIQGPNSTYVAAGSITGSNVGHNNKIDYSQYKNAKIYPTLKRDFGLLDIISPILMNRFEKGTLKKGGIISIILGILPLISGFLSSFLSSGKFSLPSSFVIWMYIIGILLIVLGIILINVTKYYDFMLCKVCKKEFTYEETGTPHTEETKTRWGYNEVTYRQYKCRVCGNIKKTRSIKEFDKEGKLIASSGEIELPLSSK
jgi:hypothetical protein